MYILLPAYLVGVQLWVYFYCFACLANMFMFYTRLDVLDHHISFFLHDFLFHDVLQSQILFGDSPTRTFATQIYLVKSIFLRDDFEKYIKSLVFL